MAEVPADQPLPVNLPDVPKAWIFALHVPGVPGGGPAKNLNDRLLRENKLVGKPKFTNSACQRPTICRVLNLLAAYVFQRGFRIKMAVVPEVEGFRNYLS